MSVAKAIRETARAARTAHPARGPRPGGAVPARPRAAATASAAPPRSGIRTSRHRAGDVPRVPRPLLTPDRVRELPIDPRVAFVLSRVDGQSTIETLIDVTGFEAGELLSILARLVRLGAVAM